MRKNIVSQRVASGKRDNSPSEILNVAYPSGKTFKLFGQFALTSVKTWRVPAVLRADGQVVVLDQRAIVTQNNRVIYSPRRNRDGLDPELSNWLNANPTWAV